MVIHWFQSQALDTNKIACGSCNRTNEEKTLRIDSKRVVLLNAIYTLSCLFCSIDLPEITFICMYRLDVQNDELKIYSIFLKSALALEPMKVFIYEIECFFWKAIQKDIQKDKIMIWSFYTNCYYFFSMICLIPLGALTFI